MKKGKQRRLEKKGWKVGDAKEFLDLSDDEAAYIELKLALSEQLKAVRAEKQVTQVELARRIKSSQSRVAKMEAGDPSVSLDLLVKTLLALGATQKEIARSIATTSVHAA